MRAAFQMDPMEGVDIDADSSFRLAEEAQARGAELWEYGPDDLSWQSGRVLARARPMTLRRTHGDHVTFGQRRSVDLAEMDVVWLRQDPPFDMGYITTTHLLDLIRPDTLVVNDPTWVRNHPEKLLVLQFLDLIPPTLVARDLATIREFRAEHGDVIVKPLYGNGGAGVFRLRPEDGNLASLHEMFTALSREPLIVQKFLPDVAEGDKRVILVDGEAVGAINRIPAQGETRSNMHVGGRAVASELTARDREICAAIGPLLRERGQVFVGIDVIGGNLTEINLTSPTGIQELERFDGINVAAMVWDAIDRRLAD
ncbi:MAG: glutathione synthase [Paracoccaceae bacterium]